MNKELLANGTLSHYRIISKIGAGGMGEVYLANDTKLDRKVALKILPQEFAEDSDRMSRFVREAKSASALNHPNIITIYEIGESDGTHFIATEFIDGKTLSDYAKANPLNVKSALEIAIQIASALDEAHSAGIVHRDIKPDNVMVRANGLVKILDFGIAKLSEPKASIGEEDATLTLNPRSSTEPGMIIGTPNYMSPEQARGKDVDHQTDIFSFGVVLYEMLSGSSPFVGETISDILAAVLTKEPPRLSEIPVELETIVHKTLQKEKPQRYQSARDLLTDLKDVKQKLEFQNSFENSVVAGQSEPETQILRATTADGISPATTNQAVTNQPKTKYLAIGLLSMVLAVSGFFGYKYLSPVKQIESIAVMPFVNDSGNADVEYLSDGMTETLISSLSQLPNLNVKPRSSVFRYKGKETNPQIIGKELNVQAILNGRVVQRGQDVSLFVELIDVALDKVVWSQQYNRRQTDLVTLQTDIARDVSSRLKTKLSGTDEAKVTKTYTNNPEAYQLYLKGKYYYSKYTENGYQKAIEYYQKAIEIDPNYALAYHGIASCYNFASDWYLPPNDAMPKAKAAVLKALELDNTLAETHYLLGIIAFWYEWDWITTEREMKRATELDPAYATYGVSLAAMGKHDEAIKEREMAQRRFPLDLQTNNDLEAVYLYAGRFDQVLDQARKTLEIDQNYWGSYQSLGLAYERKKQFPEAIAALEKARSLDNNPSILGYLGYVYAAAGKKTEAQRVLDELKELSKRRHVPPYSIAIIYAGLNDKDQAFEWLNKAYDARSFFIALLKVETVLDNLRPDPRFKALLKRMKLPE